MTPARAAPAGGSAAPLLSMQGIDKAFGGVPALRGARLEVIKGVVPSPFNLPPACRFEPRCPYAWEACREIVPPLVPARDGSGQLARCHLETEVGASRRVAAHAAHDLALDPKPDAALTGGME